MVLVTKSKPRPAPASHKRRIGHHHKKDGHYLKPYWPYIPLALIVAIGVLFSSVWGMSQGGVLSYATDMSLSGLLSSTNNQRTANGLGSLALNATLNQAAQAKANDMAARDYWSHNTPDGATPWTFFVSAGYNYQNAGENLAYGFDNYDATVTAWMNSPEHKANVLGSYTEVGFGVANNANYQGTGPETIIVAMYATPHTVAAVPAPVTPAPKPATPAPATVQQAPADTPADVPAAATEEKSADKPKEVNTTVATGATKPETKAVDTKSVSRIQLITNGQAAWSTFVVTAFAAVCLAVFFLRHGIFWHRALVKGKAFIIHHKALDITLVAVAVIGFVLTRSVGVIH